jgi:aspartate/tyrosine/aromatic aminotransferase
MFEQADTPPPDPILGLKEVVTADSRPGKIDLTAGVYCDESGSTPTFEAVAQAEHRLVETRPSKSYLPIGGDERFLDGIRALVGVEDAAAIQTPGGTAALFEAGQLLRRLRPEATVWLPSSTWPNHKGIFELAGVQIGEYPYETGTGEVAIDEMCDGIGQRVRPGDAVLVHGCCHNPSGTDPDAEGWRRIATTLGSHEVLTIADTAYLGFGAGFDADRVGLDTLIGAGLEVLACLSFSKNMGLYAERVGALLAISPSPSTNPAVLGNLKAITRTSYSNPPAWGARVAAMVMHDDELRSIWLAELDGIRTRIQDLRRQLALAAAARDVDCFAGVERQNGMFSMSGLSPDIVQALRANHGVYMLGNGRANIAGLMSSQVDPLVGAIATELAAERTPV